MDNTPLLIPVLVRVPGLLPRQRGSINAVQIRDLWPTSAGAYSLCLSQQLEACDKCVVIQGLWGMTGSVLSPLEGKPS